MLGLAVTIIFCFLAAAGFRFLFRRWLDQLDLFEGFGLAGLLGLGLVGTSTMCLGLIPRFLIATLWLVGGCVVMLGLIGVTKQRLVPLSTNVPRGWQALFTVLLGFLLLLPLLGVLTPSTPADWDTLAYHLAVPKLWLSANQVHWIQTIHHSNFPFAIDSLYLYGLSWGGECGAKAFNWAILLLGCQTLYGFARRWGGGEWSLLAPLGFAAIPVVNWEAGTGYIDGGHALYAGLGVAYVAEIIHRMRKGESASHLVLIAGGSWGLAMGTKLTGLQTFLVAGLLFLIFRPGPLRSTLKTAGLVSACAFSIASPWFVKSAVFTGNPVFPFFYSAFGGRGWDSWRAQIYENEQRSFGVGRDPARIGHAVLGLTYQPGRYVNPGQTLGLGVPTGGIGFLPILIYAAYCIRGRLSRRDAFLCAWAGLSLGLWFLLTQQSRYLAFLAVPAAILLAAAPIRWRSRMNIAPALATLAVIQALVTLFVVYQLQGANQLRVIVGQIPPDAYRKATTPFAADADQINHMNDVTEVALFDEVFGVFLDKPYFWANPGHSDRIPFESLNSGDKLVEVLKEQNVSHVYLSLRPDPAEGRKWMATAGLIAEDGYTDEEVRARWDNRETRWKILLAEAVRSGQLEPVTAGERGGILFKVR